LQHQTIDTGLDLFAVSEPQKITKQGGVNIIGGKKVVVK
jgi:hypothetical protein